MSREPSETDGDAGSGDATRRGLLRAAAGATVAGAASTAGCLSVSTPANVAAQYEVTGNVAHFVGPGWLAELLAALFIVGCFVLAVFKLLTLQEDQRAPAQ